MAAVIDMPQLTLMMKRVIADVIRNKYQEQLSYDPRVELKPIMTVNGRMKISGFEKFSIRSYIAVINFFADAKDMEKHKSSGFMAVYLKESAILKLLQVTGQFKGAALNEKMIFKVCEEIALALAQGFKKESGSIGLPPFELSVPAIHKDYVPGGVSAPKAQRQYYETSIELWDIDAMVIDLVLGF
jgi:hypothetical protein